MKAKERHHLKQNEFAATTSRVVASLTENRNTAVGTLMAVIAILAIGGGYFFWKRHVANESGAMLGVAMAIEQSPIAPPSTLPGAKQSPGTYPTEQARDEVALKAFQQVAAEYPKTDAGIAASYHIASTLLALGRLGEAETAFKTLADNAGSSLYAPMARMGLAETLLAAGKNDDAIKTFNDLSGQRDGALPVDGVLMQLARAYIKAGKIQEARSTFKRVVDEFPDSTYASDARQQLAALN